jgi:hypothetical protein
VFVGSAGQSGVAVTRNALPVVLALVGDRFTGELADSFGHVFRNPAFGSGVTGALFALPRNAVKARRFALRQALRYVVKIPRFAGNAGAALAYFTNPVVAVISDRFAVGVAGRGTIEPASAAKDSSVAVTRFALPAVVAIVANRSTVKFTGCSGRVRCRLALHVRIAIALFAAAVVAIKSRWFALWQTLRNRLEGDRLAAQQRTTVAQSADPVVAVILRGLAIGVARGRVVVLSSFAVGPGIALTGCALACVIAVVAKRSASI